MKISDSRFRQLLDRYLKGTASESERELLDKFFASYEPGIKESDPLPEESLIHDEILRRIYLRVRNARTSGKRYIVLGLSLAAAIAVFVMTFFFTGLLTHPANEIVQQEKTVLEKFATVSGQRLVKHLPDGTAVHLNSSSTISYPQTFTAVREITMTGEAFFEVVADGKPFIVHAGHVKTRVLGTSFNVKHREGKNTEITLVEGKVKVDGGFGDTLTLAPNQQAVITSGSRTIAMRDVNVLKYTSWKDDVLMFEQASLADVIDELEEWYAVDIEIINPLLRTCMITAKYQSEPVGNVLSSLQFLFNLDIKRLDDGRYTIDGIGCL